MKWNKNAASQKGRVFRSGLLSTAMLAAVLVLAVLLNLLVRAIPAKYTEFDLSEAKMYTLSDSTKALVEGLEKDVHIYYLCETGSEDTIITKLLDHYAAESGHLSWEQKDPTLYPTFAAKYGAENVSTGSLIVTCGENSTVLDAADLYEYDYSDYYTTGSASVTFGGEKQITSAIYKLTSAEPRLLYHQPRRADPDRLPDRCAGRPEYRRTAAGSAHEHHPGGLRPAHHQRTHHRFFRRGRPCG